MKSRDRRAERMSEFVTNMFQYNVTVGITRSEVIYFFVFFNHRPLLLKYMSNKKLSPVTLDK